jgi:hypothetical protein
MKGVRGWGVSMIQDMKCICSMQRFTHSLDCTTGIEDAQVVMNCRSMQPSVLVYRDMTLSAESDHVSRDQKPKTHS